MINRLLNFLNASPVNFLAVRNLVEELEKAGYRRVNPCEPLGKVAAGDKFFVTKNDSSVYAFEIGSKPLADAGFHMICAHCGSPEAFSQAVERAFMVSADNAHALHPSYTEKFDPTNLPVLDGGPVIKFNAAQKYASDAVSAAIFAEICRKAGVPCQRFVNHSDVAGGSTLGNILASSIPLRGVDMGNGILAMHSCRETGSTADHLYCVKAFTQFFS